MLMRIFGDMTQKQGGRPLMLVLMEELQVNRCSWKLRLKAKGSLFA